LTEDDKIDIAEVVLTLLPDGDSLTY
jgi:hypothetical protein